MFLAYLDESGNTGRRLDDPDQPIHWLVAVLVPEHEVLPLTLALDNVLATHVPDDPTRELHGAELFGGKGSWKGVLPATRIAVYRASLELLAQHDCVVAHASIDKERLQQWNLDVAPHLIALHFLAEKVDAYVGTHQDPLCQRALLVADETHEHEAYAIDLIADLQRRGVGAFKGRTLTNIVDTVHFVRSETNRGVQLADLVAYALARLSNGRWHSSKAGDVALRKMYAEHVRARVRTFRGTWPSGRPT